MCPITPNAMPRHVLLFSGHLIDRPGRPTPRFPPDKEPVAAGAIGHVLDELGAGGEDLALCGGACGGDLLFAEACLARGARLEIRIPFEEPEFLEQSVTFAGEHWGERYRAVKEHPRTRVLVMPRELGPTPPGEDPFARDNLWQLDAALARGPERLHFICLWDGRAGDGPGGTQHMNEIVRARGGRIHWLDTKQLFFAEVGS